MSGTIATETGRALRAARLARGLRLRDVATASGGRFASTTVAGYERAERAITLERFCDLCRIYDVRPERVLAHALRSSEGRGIVHVDPATLEARGSEQGRIVGDLVRRVAARRGEHQGGPIAIRATDLEVFATAANRSIDELLDMVAGTRTTATR